jgi:hypothetical protein
MEYRLLLFADVGRLDRVSGALVRASRVLKLA